MSIDSEIRSLERESLDDESKLFQALLQKSRVDGPKVWLPFLMDYERWDTTPVMVQDQTIRVVGEMLGDSWLHRETRVFSCNGISHRVGIFYHNRSGLTMHLIPGKEYPKRLGGTLTGYIQQEDIKPFLIGHWPVVIENEAFDIQESLFYRGEITDRKGNTIPISEISYNSSLEQLAAHGLRLPDNEEWRHACWGGARTLYFWGDDPDPSYAWTRENNPAPRDYGLVNHKDKYNSFGLVDMIGNVWELTQNSFDPDRLVFMGGSRGYDLDFIVSSNFEMLLRVRNAQFPDAGFRAAASIPGL